MTDQTPTAKPARKPRAKPAGGLKQLTQAEAEAAVASYRAANPAAATQKAQLAGRPYTLESSTVASEITRYGDAARSEIESIEADCLSIDQRANNDIQAINARRDVELAARRERIMDLDRIVAMAGAATLPPAVERTAPQITNRSDEQEEVQNKRSEGQTE